jgi:phosphoribosylformylglycinamidine cyclo-ligase
MSEISEDEMQRVFNCGIGMLVVAPADQSQDIIDRLSVLGERAYVIGTVERKEADDPALLMDPGSRSQG